MQALKIGEGKDQKTYICAHWRTFPPIGAGQDIEALRREGTITTDEYQRYLIWVRDCGLSKMDPSHCLGCPHHRRVVWKTQGPVLVDPHGTETPVVDPATGEASPRNRHLVGVFRRPGTSGSHQTAAWVPDGSDTDG